MSTGVRARLDALAEVGVELPDIVVRIESEDGTKGKRAGQYAVLADGRRLRIKTEPKKRGRKAGPAADQSGNAVTRAASHLSNVRSLHQLEDIRLGTNPQFGGRPSLYPRQLWSMIYVLQNAIATEVAILDYLAIPWNKAVLVELIREERSNFDSADQATIDRWLRAGSPVPHRSTTVKMLRSLGRRGKAFATDLRTQGVRLAVEQGRFDPAAPVDDPHCVIIGDATVVKAASSGTETETIDLNTGVITRRRPDELSLHHHEGGDKSVTVYGTKVAMIWSPSTDRLGTIALGAAFVPSPSPTIEATVSVALSVEVQGELSTYGRAAKVVAYDKAADGPHQSILNEHGMLLVTRARADDHDESSTSHYLREKLIGFHTADCGCRYVFWAKMKRLHVARESVTGDVHHEPLPHVRKESVRNGTVYHYSEHTFACRLDATQHHTLRIPWNGWKSFNHRGKNRLEPVTEKEYRSILHYLQPHAPGTDEHADTYGLRARTETMHSVVDDLLPSQRLQRWGLDSKSAFVFGYLAGHNLFTEAALRQTVFADVGTAA
jgi:hypothetical protein